MLAAGPSRTLGRLALADTGTSSGEDCTSLHLLCRARIWTRLPDCSSAHLARRMLLRTCVVVCQQEVVLWWSYPANPLVSAYE